LQCGGFNVVVRFNQHHFNTFQCGLAERRLSHVNIYMGRNWLLTILRERDIWMDVRLHFTIRNEYGSMRTRGENMRYYYST
jgi:hypothetical protein